MANQCKVNHVFAPNGEPSKLYIDLKKTLGDDQSAINAWASIHTPAFKKMYGDWKHEEYEGELDDNGEPLIDDVLSEEFREDEKIRLQSNKVADEYVKGVKKLIDHISRARDIFIRRIKDLENAKGKGSEIVKKRLVEGKKKLAMLEWRESTLLFVSNSARDIKFAKERIDSELLKKDPDPKVLHKFYGFLTAYDILSTMRNEITANPALYSSMKDDMKLVDNLISDKDGAKTRYLNFMEDRVSKKLAALSEKHDADLISQLLKEAPFDIKSRERWLLYAGDSGDTVIALVAKAINESQQKTRHTAIEFSREHADKISAVEKERSEYVGDPEKLYLPLLEKNKKGEFTGHLIQPKSGGNQYDNMMKNFKGTAILDYYEFYTKNYKYLNDGLPTSSQMGYRLPSLLKSTIELVTTGEGKLEQVKLAAKNSVVANNSDIERGQLLDDVNRVVNTIPIHFTQRFDRIVMEAKYKELLKNDPEMNPEDVKEQATNYAISQLPKNISYDLGASLQAFHYMATNYNNMSEIIDVVEGARDMVFNRKVTVTDSKGKPLISHMKDFMGDKIFHDKQQIAGAESNSYKMIQALIEMQVYGKTELDLGNFEISNMQIDRRKLLNHVRSYSSALMMGGNFLAATASVLNGETMQWADAFSREFYTPKNYLDAASTYTKELPQMVNDLTEKLPKSKINLMNQYYDVIGNYRPSGTSATDSNALWRLAKSSSIFFLNSIGEHMMQSKVAIAMFKHTQAFDSNGKEKGTLWDAHTAENGKLVIAPDTFIKDKDGKLVAFDKAQQLKMSRHVQAILRRMHGNYNIQTAAEWQRNGVLALVGQFRKWLAPGFVRRFGSKDYSEFFDQEMEGNYITALRFMANLAKELRRGSFDLVKNWDKLSSHEKANCVRTITEVSVFVATIFASMILVSLARGLDEEEDRNKLFALRYAQFATLRLQTELMSYVNFFALWQLLKSPAASMSIIERTVTTINSGLPWNWDEQIESGVHKGKNEFLVNIQRQIPIWAQGRRLTLEGMEAQIEIFKLR